MLIQSKSLSNRLILLIIFSFICLSCKQSTGSKPDDFIKTWRSVETPLFFEATLLINGSGTFYYSQKDELCEGFSNGSWVIKNSYLVLTSEKPDSCYYLTEYGNEWSTVSDSILEESVTATTTIKDCLPNQCIEFVVFEKDSFYIKNDSLFHSLEPNELFPFYTNVFW